MEVGSLILPLIIPQRLMTKILSLLQKLDNQLKVETDKVERLDLALSNCKQELKLILEEAQKTQEKHSNELRGKDLEVSQIILNCREQVLRIDAFCCYKAKQCFLDYLANKIIF